MSGMDQLIQTLQETEAIQVRELKTRKSIQRLVTIILSLVLALIVILAATVAPFIFPVAS